MSDKARNAVSWLAVTGLSFSALGGLWIAASALLAGGQILHEIKGMREDLIELKIGVSADRIATQKNMEEIMANQRKIERRVELLEFGRPGKISNFRE